MSQRFSRVGSSHTCQLEIFTSKLEFGMGLKGLIMGGAGLKSTSSMVLHVLAKPQVPGKVSVHVLLRGLYSTAADNRKGTVYVHVSAREGIDGEGD